MTKPVHASKYNSLVFSRHTGLEQHEGEEMVTAFSFLGEPFLGDANFGSRQVTIIYIAFYTIEMISKQLHIIKHITETNSISAVKQLQLCALKTV